jgi:hypothetical protein
MKGQQRIPRSYKVAEAQYKKAMRRANKEKVPLANLVETLICAFGDGADVTINGVAVKRWYEEMIPGNGSK